MIKDNPYRQPSQLARPDADTDVLICPDSFPAGQERKERPAMEKKRPDAAAGQKQDTAQSSAGQLLPEAVAVEAEEEMPDPAVMLSLPRHHDRPASFDNRIGCLGMVAAALLAAIMLL